MHDALHLAQTAHDVDLSLGAEGVLDEEEIVQSRIERKQNPFLAHERHKVVDVIVLACRVIEEGVRRALEDEVVLAGKVEREFCINAPRQLVVDQSRIDANDGGVVE